MEMGRVTAVRFSRSHHHVPFARTQPIPIPPQFEESEGGADFFHESRYISDEDLPKQYWEWRMRLRQQQRVEK